MAREGPLHRRTLLLPSYGTSLNVDAEHGDGSGGQSDMGSPDDSRADGMHQVSHSRHVLLRHAARRPVWVRCLFRTPQVRLHETICVLLRLSLYNHDPGALHDRVSVGPWRDRTGRGARAA